MTGSHAQTDRPNLVVRMWRGFRRFRKTRPFWGGLFAMLGGMEIFVIPLSSNIKVAIYGGIGGTLGYLLGALIFMMGISFWTLPHLRQLTGPCAILFSLASFVFSNLGGFFLGMLLGIIGGSLGFSWMPAMPKKEEPGGGPGGADRGDDGDDVGLSVLDERPQPPPAEGSGGGSRLPSALAVAIPALALALGLGQLAGTGMTRAYAAAPCATASPSPSPSASASTPAGTTAAATKPAASPSPSASPSPTSSGFDWFWWWPFKSNSSGTGSTAATPTATPTGTPSGSPPAQAKPKAAGTPTGCPSSPTPSGSATPKPSSGASPPAGVKPRDVPPPTGTVVAAKATTVRASLVEMYGVDYKGVTTVDLPGNKTRRVLWFQMDRLVLHNFVMTDDENAKTMQWVADPLTLQGHVNVYTADMQATLLGIPLHFTPDSPPPLVLPIMILGDLVQSQDLTTCDTLSGKPLDNKFLS